MDRGPGAGAVSTMGGGIKESPSKDEPEQG